MTPVFSVISSFLYVHIPCRCSSSSLSSYRSVSHEFLSLPFCLLTLYAEWIHFSTHDLTNFSVFVGWCSSNVCFHVPWSKTSIGSVFSPTDFHYPSPSPHFKRLQSLNVHLPQHPCFCGIQYRAPNQSLYVSLILASSFLSVILLVYWTFPIAIRRFTSSWHLLSSVITLPKYINCRTCSTL